MWISDCEGAGGLAPLTPAFQGQAYFCFQDPSAGFYQKFILFTAQQHPIGTAYLSTLQMNI